MRQSDRIIILGSMAVVMAAIFTNTWWPQLTIEHKPSREWRPIQALEERGRELYVANGCTYCHSMYVRAMDWDYGAERISKAGDYYDQRPHLLGSERTGPDLAQAGGQRSDDWHLAHFINPRYTRPRSLMPAFAFEGRDNVRALTAYVQSLGRRDADARMALQRRFGAEALAAWRRGPDENIRYLHSRVPRGWRILPTETPVTRASVLRGEKVYQDYCVGCHGAVGAGDGPAATYLRPTPVNFTILNKHLIDGKFIGGIIYYQVMNGITGSAMPYFKKDLESSKIWDVTNYLEKWFINHTDDHYPTAGIPVSYEGDKATGYTEEPLPEPIPPGTGAVR